MRISRRKLLQLAGGSLALPALTRIASAEPYPARPVRLVVGFAAGGPNDITARIIAQWLSERLGQQFIVENRPGAGSNIATELVVRSPADGYTLLLVPPPAAINTTLYDNLSFNFLRDIAPVAGIVRVPEVMVVNPSLPVGDVREFIAYAKAHPGKINMGTAGNGTMPHVAGELFKFMTGIDLVRIGYRGGGPALVDLMAGQVQVMFEPTLATLPHIRAQKLRALAVTSTTRSAVLPDVPVLADTVPGYEATAWYGIGAPKSTPAEIVERLNREINTGLAEGRIKGRLADLGGEPMPMAPAEFGKLVADETEKWGKVIRAANIRLEGG
jgi:tripartite-type tricarboxylate transporter receptor subunit TctC